LFIYSLLILKFLTTGLALPYGNFGVRRR